MGSAIGRPTKYDPKYADEVLDFVGHGGKSVAEYARHLDVSRSTVYKWADEHPDFSDALTRAKEYSEARWEEITRDMMVMPQVNTALVKLYLANRFGWSDRQSVEHSGPGGEPLFKSYQGVDPDKV